jgi:DnaK suppressor protein
MWNIDGDCHEGGFSNGVDAADFAQKSNEVYLDAALKAQLAKNKIATPSEGRLAMTSRECLDCGEKINPKRLTANPKAVRCIECQTAKERRNGDG